MLGCAVDINVQSVSKVLAFVATNSTSYNKSYSLLFAALLVAKKFSKLEVLGQRKLQPNLLGRSWNSRSLTFSKTSSVNKCSDLVSIGSSLGVDRNGGWNYLKCPNCSNRSRMEILVKKTGKKAIQSK